MDKDLKALLLELLADVRARRARIGDIAYDTLVAAYSDLMNSKPNYGYVRRILAIALHKDCPC